MSKLIKNYGLFCLIIASILLFGFVIRIFNLTILPVFADEAIYVRWAQVMRAEATLRFLPLSDGKQPFFMWVIIPFLKLFKDPLFAGRIVSVLSGMGTILGITTFSFVLFKSKKVSVISAFLYAVSPFAIFYDRLSLADSMLAMFGVWFFTFFLLAVKYLRFDLAMISGFSLGFSLLTKSPALFFVILSPLTFIFANFSKKRLLVLIKLGLIMLAALAIGYGMYGILRLGPEFHMIAIRNLDYVWPITRILTSPLDPLKPHFNRVLEWIWVLGPSLIYPLFIVGVVSNIKKYPKQIFLLFTLFLFPILVQSEFAKVLTARYVFFSLPYLFILAGSAFLINLKKTNILLGCVVAAFLIQSMSQNFWFLTNPERANLPSSERSGYLEEWTAGTGIKETADYIKNEAKNLPVGQKIVIGTEGYFGTLPDGLQIYLEKIPNVLVIGVGLDIGDVPQSLKDSKKDGNKTYLVANSSRLVFKEDFSKRGLKIIAQYKKADRLEITRERVKHGDFDTFYFFEVTDSAIE